VGGVPKSVLVTGGSGFLGSSVVSGLYGPGIRITVLDRTLPSPRCRFILRDTWPQIDFIQGDVAVLANRHPVATDRTDIQGTLCSLETARLLGISKVVISSSMAVLVAPRTVPIAEANATLDPSTRHPTGHMVKSRAGVRCSWWRGG
jgi:nucleoside-diphosphate-sugar epimerase